VPKETIRNLARQAGFPFVGFAAAGVSARATDLERWLAAGYHGELAWLARRVPERQDPRRLLPGTRTVLLLGVPHEPGDPDGRPEPPPPPGWGRVARFARSRDYHRVLVPRLKELGRELARLLPGVSSRGECDTGAVLERAWAQEAGRGFVGWHAGLIVPAAGSWVTLAAVLLDRELPPDGPDAASCAACGECLTRCPTGALQAPGIVDARRCIAYLTIEARGPIPRAWRAALGWRLFGCDACQEGCPHNRAPAPADPELAALPGRRDLELGRVLRLGSEEELLAWLPGSPVRRPKLAGLKRNACLVLGNGPPGVALPELIDRLQGDESPMVRGAAAWALGRMGERPGRQALARALDTETEPGVRQEILAARERRP